MFLTVTVSAGTAIIDAGRPFCARAASGESCAWGCLLLLASVSAGVAAEGSAAVERSIDRAATRVAGGTWRTAVGIVCDRTTAAADTDTVNGEPPGPRRIRSVTMCSPSGTRPRKIRLSFLKSPPEADGINVGDVILATGLAELPRAADNPFGFDEAGWLGSSGIHALMTDPARIRVSRSRARPAFAFRGRTRSVGDALRKRIDRRFEIPRHRALAAAIFLGDRSDIDRGVRDRFVRSGLMHLLALSGLHVGLIGGFVWIVLDSSLRRIRAANRVHRSVRTVLWTAAMGLYGSVVAWPVSVIRALVMAAAFLIASTAGRRCSPWHVYGVAASVLLLISPSNLFSAGFQLSFAAVGGIILVRPEKDPHPSCVRDETDAARAIRSAIRSSVAAGVATMPVLLFHFGSAPTGGIVLSPPGILLMGPVLASTIAAVLLPAAAASPFASTAAAGLDALIVLGGVETTWLPVIRHVPGSWTPLLGASLLVGGLVWMSGGRRRLRLLTAAAAAMAGLLVFEAATSVGGPVHRVVFFAAGQGDATLVHSASGQTILIDAAPGAVRPLLDYAGATGLDRIDTVVLTHDHADHTAGLSDLSNFVPVGRIVHTGWLDADAGRSDRIVSAGDTLALGPGVRIDVLNPDVVRDTHGNDDSIALRLRIGVVSILLMGDAETAAESRIVRRYGELLVADVVKAGHHGSGTSSSPRFVRSTEPDIVILSAGLNNRFGHPSREVVERWQTAGARVHVTSEHGALVLETNGIRIRVRE